MIQRIIGLSTLAAFLWLGAYSLQPSEQTAFVVQQMASYKRPATKAEILMDIWGITPEQVDNPPDIFGGDL